MIRSTPDGTLTRVPHGIQLFRTENRSSHRNPWHEIPQQLWFLTVLRFLNGQLMTLDPNLPLAALVLVGGDGTQLCPLTLGHSKPLVEFCNRPMVELCSMP
jgi:hypothetical protein